ncbi:DinI-like family protein [Acerihabitans arboris]|uniref:DinI-like family protein n=1 Tax=Acerihabitans arboris TaxID=2691583 RepID=A0A845SQR1_9GAMM|nr:DinI-like family protein [Acerihabitans arboris]NDL64938.1 DinI-like family protein [Acerihabitans arboris]
MRVELIYDKRNFGSLANAGSLILAELTKRVQRVFPDAEVKIKPMQRNGLETDASKSDKAILARLVEEMFDDSAEWLTVPE